MSQADSSGQTICAECGAVFVCGVSAGSTQCWCMADAVRLPVPVAGSGASCLCPACLVQARAHQASLKTEA